MTFLTRSLFKPGTGKRVLVAALSLLLFIGFETLSYIAGLYQIATFLYVAVGLYLYLVLKLMLLFDVRLRIPRSWQRASYYYSHNKVIFHRSLLILWRSVKLRFSYLSNFRHFAHFQNFLILPGFAYWSIIVLVFLNPFNDLSKHALVVAGTLLMGLIIWYVKTVFIHYQVSTGRLRSVMFMLQILAAFLSYSALLGLVWYFGLSQSHYILGVGAISFLLMYQSLFRIMSVRLNTVSAILFGSVAFAFVSSLIFEKWSVNYYSAGLTLAACQYFYWGIIRAWALGRFKPVLVLQYGLVLLFVIYFVMATTNFNARIG